jgi:hypothetical protein
MDVYSEFETEKTEPLGVLNPSFSLPGFCTAPEEANRGESESPVTYRFGGVMSQRDHPLHKSFGQKRLHWSDTLFLFSGLAVQLRSGRASHTKSSNESPFRSIESGEWQRS